MPDYIKTFADKRRYIVQLRKFLFAMSSYLQQLQLGGGGFMAAVWDESHDVEYTFYGLGCLSLIANHQAAIENQLEK